MKLNWKDFEVGFWHPFGPHGGESRQAILQRKAEEIEKNGWTLWSFQSRESLEEWFEILRNANSKLVYVLLSDSSSTRDPSSEVKLRSRYRLAGDAEWRQVPATIKIPHPGRSELASAFLVKAIIRGTTPLGVPPFTVSWYSVMNGWRTDDLPTRGEYLIRRDEGVGLRRVYAALELRFPYLATLKT